MLHKLQSTFMDSVYKECDDLVPHVKSFGDITNEERVNIYRNTAFVGLKVLLADTFPCVVKMVDIEFFRYLAHMFITENPPTRGDLGLYGENFPAFIKKFKALESYPYLSEIADLEWAMHKSYDATDDASYSIENFQNYMSDDIENLTLNFVSSVHLFAFSLPVFTLWESVKEEKENIEDVDLTQNEYVLVFRDADLNVQVLKLAQSTFMFYTALHKNSTFVEASATTDADIQDDLIFALKNNLFKQKEK